MDVNGSTHRLGVLLLCAAGLGCSNGEATPLSTAKPRAAAMKPVKVCTPPPPTKPDIRAVSQTTLDDWLMELAKSFAGYDKAVALSDLASADGRVLIHRGDVIQSFAGRQLATVADVVDAYTRLVAPTSFEVSVLRKKQENIVRVPLGYAHGQQAFHQYAAGLVVAKHGDELELNRLRFRALRAYGKLARHSAQWRRNGTRGAGLQIIGVRPEWLYDALGLRDNDVLRTVDGVSYGSGGQLVRALFTASLAASNDVVTLELTRDGRHLTRRYHFVGPSYRALGTGTTP